MYKNMVNKEAVPLLFAVIIPIILVSLVLLYNYGYDLTKYLRGIDILYYIIVFPIVLGLLVAILRSGKE
jgi:hypothetical protein